MKSSVGEPVDGEDVASVRLTPIAEPPGVVWGHFSSGLVGETEPDGEWGVAGHSLADDQEMGFEVAADIGPRFSRVDVRAVCEHRTRPVVFGGS